MRAMQECAAFNILSEPDLDVGCGCGAFGVVDDGDQVDDDLRMQCEEISQSWRQPLDGKRQIDLHRQV